MVHSFTRYTDLGIATDTYTNLRTTLSNLPPLVLPFQSHTHDTDNKYKISNSPRPFPFFFLRRGSVEMIVGKAAVEPDRNAYNRGGRSPAAN